MFSLWKYSILAIKCFSRSSQFRPILVVGPCTLTGGFDFQYGDSHGCSVVTKCLKRTVFALGHRTAGQTCRQRDGPRITASLNAPTVTDRDNTRVGLSWL